MVLTQRSQFPEQFGLFSNLSSLIVPWNNACNSTRFGLPHMPPGWAGTTWPGEAYALATPRSGSAGVTLFPRHLCFHHKLLQPDSSLWGSSGRKQTAFLLLTYAPNSWAQGPRNSPVTLGQFIRMWQGPSLTSCGNPQFLRLVFLKNPQEYKNAPTLRRYGASGFYLARTVGKLWVKYKPQSWSLKFRGKRSNSCL